MDFAILNGIQNLRTDFLDWVMPYITLLGSGGAVWIAVTVILLIVPRGRIAGITSVLAMIIGTVLFTLLMKNFVGRERPFNQPEGLFNAMTLLIAPPMDRYSFPSGHSLISFASAASIFLYHKRIGAVCLILAVIIAFSRLYLYVHFPSDVICGAVFGALCAVVSQRIVKPMRNK